MDIEDTYKTNKMNLNALADYLNKPRAELLDHYEELRTDAQFLAQLNERITETRDRYGFHKGIFSRGELDSVDWFAYERILIYVALRSLRPRLCLETGVFYGGNTVFALQALHQNGQGKLISIDLPDSTIRTTASLESRHSLVGESEFYMESLTPGFLVPETLKSHWELRLGDSRKIIPALDAGVDFFIHDSEHSMEFVQQEMSLVWPKLQEGAFLIVDDVDWSNGFFAFCVEHKLHPLLFTDNGKDELRVRGGCAWLGNPRNQNASYTGR